MQDCDIQFQRLWHNKSPMNHKLQIHSESDINVEVIRVNDKLPKLKPYSPLRNKTPTRSISPLLKNIEKSSDLDRARLKNSHELSFGQEDEFIPSIPKVYLPEILKSPTPPKFQANHYTQFINKVSSNPTSSRDLHSRNKSPIRSLNSVPRFQTIQNARSLLISQNDKNGVCGGIEEGKVKKLAFEKSCVKHERVELKVRCNKCDIDYCPVCSGEHILHREEARRYPSVSDIAPLKNSLFEISENDTANYIREGTPSLAFQSNGSGFNETGKFVKESSRQLLPLVIYREDPHEYIDDSPTKLKGRQDSGMSTESSESKSPSSTNSKKSYTRFSRHNII